MTQFARLERAVMLLENPDTFRSDEGTELNALLKQIRSALGSPVPGVLPMVPDEGRERTTR